MLPYIVSSSNRPRTRRDRYPTTVHQSVALSSSTSSDVVLRPVGDDLDLISARRRRRDDKWNDDDQRRCRRGGRRGIVSSSPNKRIHPLWTTIDISGASSRPTTPPAPTPFSAAAEAARVGTSCSGWRKLVDSSRNCGSMPTTWSAEIYNRMTSHPRPLRKITLINRLYVNSGWRWWATSTAYFIFYVHILPKKQQFNLSTAVQMF